MLEFAYQIYIISGLDRHKTTEILVGKVNFETFELTVEKEIINVRRTVDNVRSRPNGYNRHDPFLDTTRPTNEMNFISPTDLEWMSLNYRKERANNLSPSKRRMILVMFQKDISYFPKMREIRDGLVNAQIKKIQDKSKIWGERTQFASLKKIYKQNWDYLFQLASLGDMDKPLTKNILSNPEHNITKHILYLYSMESFIYGDLNHASREKDQSQIQFYGAYAAALSYIIYFANTNRTCC